MTTTPSIIELSETTHLIALVGVDTLWAETDVGSLPNEFRALVWTGSAVRIATVTKESVQSGSEKDVHKVMVGGVKVRCSAQSAWRVIKRGEQVRMTAKDLKSGDQVLTHPRFGKDAPHNLVGYTKWCTTNLAQVKTANEDIPLVQLSVQGGGAILLSNGVFCG